MKLFNVVWKNHKVVQPHEAFIKKIPPPQSSTTPFKIGDQPIKKDDPE